MHTYINTHTDTHTQTHTHTHTHSDKQPEDKRRRRRVTQTRGLNLRSKRSQSASYPWCHDPVTSIHKNNFCPPPASGSLSASLPHSTNLLAPPWWLWRGRGWRRGRERGGGGGGRRGTGAQWQRLEVAAKEKACGVETEILRSQFSGARTIMRHHGESV